MDESRRDRAGVPGILRDTGTLFGALDVGGRGTLFKDLPNGIRVGFSGTTRHPKGKATLADIAGFHDQGGKGGRPPQRQILVAPDQATVRGMLADAERATARMLQKHNLRTIRKR